MAIAALFVRGALDRPLLGLVIGAALLVAVAFARQASLARQTARLRADLLGEWRETFDAIDSPILVADGQGGVTRLNEAAVRLAGAEREACLGREIESLGSGEPWVTAARLAREARHARKSLSERATEDHDGRVWDVVSRLVQERNPAGRVIVIVRDVTRLVELEDSLRHGEKVAAMGALVAGVSHEVRNPLFGLSATLDAFEARFGGRDEFAGYLVVLRKQVGRVTDLMAELMEFGKPSTERRAIPISELLDEAFAECQRPEGGAGLVTSGDCSLPVYVDRKRLLLVFRNLIENALFHAPDGRVRVEARSRRRRGARLVEVTVQDAGPGFPEEHLTRVFEPFFTLRRGGAGLGLAIAQRIVLEHGGSITAANHPAGGAVVTVRLPAASSDSS